LIKTALRYLLGHRASLLSIAVRASTVAIGFAIAFAIGRAYGPEANGQYALVTQTAIMLSIVVVGGLDISVVKDFSAAGAFGKRPSRRSLAILIGATLGIALLVTVPIMLAGGAFFARFNGAEIGPIMLAWLSLIFISRAFTRLTSAFLRSQRRYVFSQVVEGLLIPIPVVLAIALGLVESVDEIVAATAIAGIPALLIGVASSLRLTASGGEGQEVSVKKTYLTALPLWLVAIIKNFGDWYALAIVGLLMSVSDVGLFRIASQVASALPIITISIFSVFSPQIAAAYARGDMARIARLGRSATRLSLVLVLPAVALLMVAANPLLGLVGQEFTAATLTLQLLLAGQAIYVATGPCGTTLALTGHQKVNLRISATFFALFLILVPLSGWLAGIDGVAITMSGVVIVQNIASFLAVRRLLGINLITGSYSPPPAATSPGAAPG